MVEVANYGATGFDDWDAGPDRLRGDTVSYYYTPSIAYDIETESDGLQQGSLLVWQRYSQGGPGYRRVSPRFNTLDSVSDSNYIYEPVPTRATGFGAFVGGQAAPFGAFRQQVVLAGDQGVWETHEDWVNYVRENYTVDTPLFNHTNKYSSPYGIRELNIQQRDFGGATVGTAKIKYDYNFNIPKYESTIAPSAVPESILPNLYTLYLDEDRLTFEPPVGGDIFDLLSRLNSNTLYDEFITLDSTMRADIWNPRLSLRDDDIRGALDAGDYYIEWSNTYPTVQNNPSVQSLATQYTNILIPPATMGTMEGMNIYSNLFPMFADIEFTLPPWIGTRPAGNNVVSDSDLSYASLLNDGEIPGVLIPPNIIDNLMRAIVYDQSLAAPYFTNDIDLRVAGEFLNFDRSPPMLKTSQRQLTRKVFDFGSWLINSAVFAERLPSSYADGVSLDALAESSEDDGTNNWALFVNSFFSDPGFQTQMLSPTELGHAVAYIRNTLRNVGAYSDRYGPQLTRTVFDGGRAQTYSNALFGGNCWSEDLFFKVTKYRRGSNGTSRAVVQTYHIPNNRAGREKVRFIDSQLKYGQTYEYEISTYRLVVGSQTRFSKVEVLTGEDIATPPTVIGDSDSPASSYRPYGTWEVVSSMFDDVGDRGMDSLGTAYSFHRGFEDSVRYARIQIETVPSMQVIELPYIDSESSSGYFGVGSVADNPPLPPEIDIVSYKGVNNRLLINLNTAVGAVYREPVVFQSDLNTAPYIDNLLRHNDDPYQRTILYENDDPSVSFEILRLSKHPVRIEDFEDATRYVVSGQSENTGFRKISSTGFIDKISPNIKYYYMFRAYDAHDHVSYPSSIYEVELVDSDGAVFPKIRTVPLLTDAARKTKTKKLRRFLQIKPQVSQTILNVSALRDEAAASGRNYNESAPVSDTLPMGIEEVPVWGKKFKIRLTSKKTGRKLDLNVHFSKEYDDDRREG